MSDTLRTDAAVIHGDEPQFVLADFARELERENAALRAELDRQRIYTQTLEEYADSYSLSRARAAQGGAK